ncbi:MAG: GAF domain-containing protein [Drouetiella hepatica Uher 2000/2452]|jgi:signal transduction histidine kinase|uniref:histidine kinase n=1 Tax=Drouetiella hepatica Uher 2000/2452 TaxID=904376 RepID=A0A951QAG4_9CYAN|nr:GAF domain-containing protein [Drouetiella hepatica Uher 2000/2452]
MPSSFPEQPLEPFLEELAAALADLRSTVTNLHQQNQGLMCSYQAAIEARDHHRVVREIARRLQQLLSSSEILEQTVVAARELLQSDRVIFYQLQAQPDQAQPGQPQPGQPQPGQPNLAVGVAEAVRLSQSSVMHANLDPAWVCRWLSLFRNAVPLVIENRHQADLLPPIAKLMARQQIHALIAAPIFLKESLFGWLAVHQCDGDRVWKEAEVEALQQLAAEVAIAFQQSILYQRAQQLNSDLEEQVQQRTHQIQTALVYESMLKRVTDKVRDSLDGSQILQTAVRELTFVLKLGGCNAALYDLDQGTSTVRYEFTRSIPTSQGRVSQMDDFPEIYQQLKQGHPLQFCSLLPNADRGRVAMLACPIFVDPQSAPVMDQKSVDGSLDQGGTDQGILGDLWLIHQADHVFHEFEIRLVQQVANQCAIAIRQAQLYQTAQNQVWELEKLNRLKDDFLSTVSHELRTPITNVKMAVQMLRIASTEDKRQRYLDILEKEAAREASLIDDLLDLQRLEATIGAVELEEIDLQAWIVSLGEAFQARFADRQHQFQMSYSDRLPIVLSNEAMLRRVLAELLNNACKYTQPGGMIQLDIRHQLIFSPAPPAAAPRISFRVSNQANISSDELPKIFDKFYRCLRADPWSQGGTGLGLALVEKLVEHLQGTIQVESKEGWTTFEVMIPIQLG